MKRSLQVLLCVSWALWFGGMISLFIFVSRLFITDRDVATHAAPVLFQAFAIYQIIVGMIACACGTLLTMQMAKKSLAIGTAAMAISLGLSLILRMWTFEMMTLNRSLVSDVARFQTLHHSTTNVYTTSAVLLLIAGIMGVIGLIPGSRQRAGETAAARGFPGEVAGRSPVA